MDNIQITEKWLKSVFNINRELDFERESLKYSIKRIEELEKKKEEICKVISLIERPEYKQILHKRYIQGKKWEDIMDELHYARQHIFRLHKNAVIEVHKVRSRKLLSGR